MGFLVAIALLAASAPPARADVLLSDSVMQRTKQAVVFVRIDRDNRTVSSGSGFLVRRTGRTGYIVTNDHVIAPAVSEQLQVNVVFQAGTVRERLYPATIVARDTEVDLAVVKVEAGSLPSPLGGSKLIEPKETTRAFIFGFPFGRTLSTSDKNPAVTIAPAVVSSIRRDERGEPVIIQIQGDVNPGNSGGPVIDPNGHLLGVASAKVLGTLIGFCIAPNPLNDLFLGGLNNLSVELTESGSDYIKLHVQVALSNPMDTISSVSVLILPKSKVSPKPGDARPSRRSAMSKDMAEHGLSIDDTRASGDITIRSKDVENEKYWIQAKCFRKNTTYAYTEPHLFDPKAVQPGVVRNRPAADVSAVIERPQSRRAGAPAADDWLGARQGSDASLITKRSDVLGAKVVRVDLGRAGYDSQLRVIWSADARSFYSLSISEQTRLCTVRKVALSDFREESRTVLEKPGAYGYQADLACCSAGILVQIADELLILNPATLQVTKRLRVPGCVRFATAPSLNTAFCFTGSAMVAVDLDKGTSTIIKTADLKPPSRAAAQSEPLRSFNGFFAVSPDGRYLLVRDKSFHRFRIQAKGLAYEEVGPAIVQDSSGFVFTPDSRAIITRVRAPANDPSEAKAGECLMPLSDLSREPTRLPGGHLCVIDPVTGWLYQGDHSGFVAHTPQGVPQRHYDLRIGDCSRFPGAILIHPSGSRLLVTGSGGCCWVELPDPSALAGAVTDAPQPTADTDAPKTATIQDNGLTFISGRLRQSARDRIVLSRTGDSVFLLAQDYALRQLSLPDLKPQRQLKIGHEATSLHFCRDGLLVHVTDLQELWLVNDADLTVSKRMPWCMGTELVGASPALPLAFGIRASEDNSDRLIICDLGRSLDNVVLDPREIPFGRSPGGNARSIRRERPSFRGAAVSPDGEYIVCARPGFLFRMSIKGTSLECEEVAVAEQITGTTPITFSPDSKYFGIGNLIYKTTDLRSPVMRMPDGCGSPGFDPRSGRVYCMDSMKHTLCVVGREGQVEKQYKVPTSGKVFIHPERQTLVVFGENTQLLVAADLTTIGK